MLQFMWLHDSHLMRLLSNEGKGTIDKFIAMLYCSTHGRGTIVHCGVGKIK